MYRAYLGAKGLLCSVLGGMLSFGSLSACVCCTGNWNVDADGEWTTPSNWSGSCVPFQDAHAQFLNINTHPLTISIGPGALIDQLNIDSANAYTFVSTGGGVLGFTEDEFGNESINVTNSNGNGTFAILAPITQTDVPFRNLYISQSSPTPLTIAGAITGNVHVILNGPQTVVLSGNQNYPSTEIAGGTLVVTDSLTNQVFLVDAGGTLAVNYVSPTNFSQVNAVSGVLPDAGTITLSGGNLLVNAPASAISTSAAGVPILQAVNGITGTFNSVTTSSPQLRSQLIYAPDSVSLIVMPLMAPAQVPVIGRVWDAISANANQRFLLVGNRLIQMHRTLLANQNFNALSLNPPSKTSQPGSKAPMASTAHLGPNASSHLVAYDPSKDLGYVQGLLLKGSRGSELLADDTETIQQQQKLRRAVALPKKELPGRFYIGPTGTVGKLDGTDFWATGVNIGGDYAFSQWGIGGIMEYEHTSGEGFIIDDVTVTLYGLYSPEQMPELAVNALLGYEHDWLYFHTRKGFPGDMNTAKGTPQGNGLDALLGIVYTFEQSKFTSMPQGLQVSPWATLQYEQDHIQHYSERGAKDFDLEFKSFTGDSLRFALQLVTFYTRTWGSFTFSPQVNVGWQREFLDKGLYSSFREAGSTNPFVRSKVPSVGRNYAIAGLDLLFNFDKKYEIEGIWNFEWNKLYYDSQFYLFFNYLF